MAATVVDGSQIKQLVENKEAFVKYVEEKFAELDEDNSGTLSPEELRPAVGNIGRALGLPPQGSSPDSDHIYEEVMKEFLHGKTEHIGKEEFSVVLADILLGIAEGLRRDPITMLDVNGEQLVNYAKSSEFEVDAVTIYSQIQTNQEEKSMEICLLQALEKIPVDKGMPPASDPTVKKNIVEPVLKSAFTNLQRPADQAEFVEIFQKFVLEIASQLRATPVTVAHSEKVYDGKGVTEFLRQKAQLEKTLETTWKSLPKDHHGALPREYLRVALDVLAPAASLPPFGAVEEMDNVIAEVFKMVGADEGGVVNQKEFNKLMLEILGSIMLQLQGNSVSVSSDAVVTGSSSSNCLPL